MRVHWDSSLNPPEDWVKVDLGNEGIFLYMPITSFDLSKDPCSSWLRWVEITPVRGDNIRALAPDPSVDIDAANLDTRIGTTLLFKEFMEDRRNNESSFGGTTGGRGPFVELSIRQIQEIGRLVSRNVSQRLQQDISRIAFRDGAYSYGQTNTNRPPSRDFESQRPPNNGSSNFMSIWNQSQSNMRNNAPNLNASQPDLSPAGNMTPNVRQNNFSSYN